MSKERKDKKDETKTMDTDCRCVFCPDDRADDIFQGSIFCCKSTCERDKGIQTEDFT